MAFRIVGINFDHFHMGDLLRMAHEHPDVEIVGLSDEKPERMVEAQRNFGIEASRLFADYRSCLETTRPDLVICCPAAARHAEWTEKIAPFEVALLIEKPFAATLEEADRMIAAMEKAGQPLAINWPLAWYRSHVKCHALIKEGVIGDLQEVHYYDGNRGPLWHGADKIEKEPTESEKEASWFYQAKEGGGSLQDYLGYGTTLATWFNGGEKPIEVMAMWDCENSSLEVDEHSITVARYASGLSKFETRWGTFTDPWTNQPYPRCGFVVKGTEGTIASWDYDDAVTVQTNDFPDGMRVDAPELEKPLANPVQYLVHCLREEEPIEGPLSTQMSRIGQQIVDTAFASAEMGRALALKGN